MHPVITEHKQEIARLCDEYGVVRLELFGSATGSDFDPHESDLDFIVDLGGYERGVAKRFLHFARALESLLGKSVDLITDEQIRNPYFRQAIEEQRVTVYSARDRQAAA
jgi:predicted nucleotidyltransferase